VNVRELLDNAKHQGHPRLDEARQPEFKHLHQRLGRDLNVGSFQIPGGQLPFRAATRPAVPAPHHGNALWLDQITFHEVTVTERLDGFRRYAEGSEEETWRLE
jgi:hypothetical protein